ncbi:efflux RND transporter permease subunit [candidate division KSB1 bacterium]|nr:efflux RND transporter permease subunit [candidate division KSB1 bacterium]
MNLPELATKRPVATIMVFLTVSLLGLISLRRLSVDLLPDLSYPVLAIRTIYPNAAPEEVENLVTRPIEDALSGIPDLRQIASSSYEGSSLVTVEFGWGSNMDFTLLNIREKLDQLRHLLPDDADRPTIINLDPASEPIIIIAATGRDLYLTRQFAQDVLKRRLEQIDGVAMVSVTGGAEREIHVDVKRLTLDALHLRVEQIAQALQLSNYSFPGGTIRAGQYRYALRTLGEFTSLRDIESVIIAHHPDGSAITLGQIATVADAEKERIGVNRLNGTEAVGLLINKQAGANTVSVARQVDAVLKQLRAEYADITIVEIHNQAHFIVLAIDNVVQAIVAGSILAIVVLFIFLHDVRLPLVIAISIPVSLLAAFLLFLQCGVDLNIMSLGGLAIGIGLLVDNSIIVLENIFRLRGDQPDERSAAQGAAEVAAPLLASTLTTIAAFLPILFIRGIAGQLFRDQAFAVACSLLASLPTALTLIPVLTICRTARQMPGTERLLAQRPAGEAQNPFHSTLHFYERLLARALAKPMRCLVPLGLLLLSSALAFWAVQKELMPAVGSDELIFDLSMAPGAQLEQVIEASEQLEKLLLAEDDLVSVFVQIAHARYGFEMVANMRMESARFRVRCREKRDPKQMLVRLEREWRCPPGSDLTCSEAESAIDRLFHVSDADLCISITGPDLQTLRALDQDVRKQALRVQGICDVRTTGRVGAPEIRIHIDREKAAHLGITSHHVADAIHDLQGLAATQFKEFDQQTDIIVRSTSGRHATWDEVLNMYLSAGSASLPLRSIVNVDIGRGPGQIDRRNQVRCSQVYANVDGRSLAAVIADLQERCAKINIPTGYEIHYGGVNEAMRHSFRELRFALIVAVLLIYMILAAQFESLRHPFIIILSVPMAFIGVVWALLLTDTSLNILSFIGIVALAGIAVNDAIIKISFINQRRRQGLDLMSAIIEAGRMRFRPIVMTSATTIFGLLPLAFSAGPGNALARPLAITIIGGLLTSTLLTLLVIPVLYYSMEKKSELVKRQRVQA